MRFYSDFLRSLRTAQIAFASATLLATLIACSDASGPAASLNEDVPPPGVTVLSWTVADSLKNPPLALSSAGMAAPRLPLASIAASSGGAHAVVASPTYTLSKVAFAPEAAPTKGAGPNCDDCLWVGFPLGFTFAFFGNSYDKINIGSNGIVGFGVNLMRDGCCSGSLIPLNDVNNNIIALAQGDWMPNGVAAAIRYETRGSAPNRRFVLQFNNVPEYQGNGRLTVQLVLFEGSNEIIIHTSTLSAMVSNRPLTQGIENSSGSEASFVQGRVRVFFNLGGDAIKFSPARSNVSPSVLAPANIAVNTDPGFCAAVVQPGMGTGSDDAPGFSVSSARSDGLALDAPYQKGVTTITWTATDAEGLKANAPQTITVTDNEKPSIAAPANVSVDNDRGLWTAAVDAGTPATADNCPNVGVVGSRSDYLTLGEPYRIGVTTIVWTAIDASRNDATASQTITVRDAEAPVLSVPTNFVVEASSAAGAVVNFVPTAGDNVGVTGLYCTPPSGSLFPLGVTAVECTARDAAGNQTSKTFQVTVEGAAAQITALIQYVERLGLHNGTANPMLNQLRHALNAVESGSPDVACKKMNDFMRMLGSHKASGHMESKVAAKTADYYAGRILSVLGCQ